MDKEVPLMKGDATTHTTNTAYREGYDRIDWTGKLSEETKRRIMAPFLRPVRAPWEVAPEEDVCAGCGERFDSVEASNNVWCARCLANVVPDDCCRPGGCEFVS
jgi:hypothetical protein